MRSSRHLRGYREGDEGTFVGLWNRAYADFGGYVPRTVPHWKWCILDRPGISADDICVLTEGAKVLGYGVLGAKGHVLELAIEPALSIHARREIATSLCDAMEERAINKGDEMIQILVPSTDPIIGEVLRDRHFREEAGEFLNMTVVNPVLLIRGILEHRRTIIPRDWMRTFLLKLDNGYYRFNPFPWIYIAIGDQLTVEAATGEEPVDYRVDTDLSVFTDILLNRGSVRAMVESGRLRVEPLSGISEVVQLMNCVTLRTPWYSPYADGR